MASFNPNATTIRVPYNRSTQTQTETQIPVELSKKSSEQMALKSCEPSSELSRLHNLRDRLDSIAQTKGSTKNNQEQIDHFDYRTIVANLTPIQHNNVQTIINNNVHSITQQQSPFMNSHNISNFNDVTKVSLVATKNPTTITTALLASSSSGFGSELGRESEAGSLSAASSDHKPYMLKQFIRQPDEPMTKVTRVQLNNDAQSLMLSDIVDSRSISSESLNSLKSCKTYNVNRETSANADANANANETELNDDADLDAIQSEQQVETFDVCSRAPAWIFNPNDGSSLMLKPPPKPTKPPTPETKTEQLAESRGGRSYYLELIEPSEEKKSEQTTTKPKLIINSRVPINNKNRSMESLYSRWSSMNTLNNGQNNNNNNNAINETYATHAANNRRRNNTQLKCATNDHEPSNNNNNKLKLQSQLAKSTPKLEITNNQTNLSCNRQQALKKSLSRSERQICPAKLLIDNEAADNEDAESSSRFNRMSQVDIPFALRSSKSSSCLASAVKPSKYSIYGGLRTKDLKAVPRLSYSRAIGPRLQRPNGLQQVKTLPSRYLKMK